MYFCFFGLNYPFVLIICLRFYWFAQAALSACCLQSLGNCTIFNYMRHMFTGRKIVEDIYTFKPKMVQYNDCKWRPCKAISTLWSLLNTGTQLKSQTTVGNNINIISVLSKRSRVASIKYHMQKLREPPID